jgi:hypothetical protein
MKKTDFRFAMLGILMLGIFSSLVVAKFLALSTEAQTATTTTTTTSVKVKSSTLLTDGNLVLASSNDAQRGYWLTGRETSFALPNLSQKKDKAFKITAGLDPCGRQSKLEVSALGQAPITLDSESQSITYSSAAKRLYARSLGAACLIDTDARVFFGRLEVRMYGLENFPFNQ